MAADMTRNLNNRMSSRRLASSLVLLGGMLLVVGCGGSGSRSSQSDSHSQSHSQSQSQSHTDSITASATAPAASRLITMIQDDAILASPATELPLVRALGATTVRVFVTWYSLAPDPAAEQPPEGFNGSDPNAYPMSSWRPYDQLVEDAQRNGITVDFELTGGSPRWASGADPPASAPGYIDDRRYFSWEPNPAMYGQFVHAVTERYDGGFTPAGSSAALPRVHFWSFWNEPNFGQDLGPQATDGSTVSASAQRYRALLKAAWTAVQQTGHAQDTTLIGEIAAKGYGLRPAGHPGPLPGNTAQTRALDFVRYVYCLDADYQPLRGTAATQIGCPADAAGSREFRAQNPALFDAAGFAVHAYDSKQAPDANPATIDPDDATFPVLGRVATALDRMTGAYGSDTHFPIYNDEFGYITSPPQSKGNGDPSPALAAVELNQAEYLSYKNPRVAAYSQYLIKDPPPNPNPGFSSGLFNSDGTPKATLSAFRMPLWLPNPTVRRGSTTEIWGGARPAAFADQTAQRVDIQMQNGGRGPWKTITTAAAAPGTGYIDIHTTLPYSGNLRLAYTYPKTGSQLPPGVPGTTIVSRTVAVTVTG
jgi:hypothetical protein